MTEGALGRVYQDGEVIIYQGEVGNCMYIVQEGQVEVFVEKEGQEIQLELLGEGEIVGEMAIFENEVRSATVRASGQARLLTVDKRNFLRRVHEDPSLAYRIVQSMSHRIREMNKEVARLTRARNQ
jgi:CRP-like cAMP-binding protein